MSKVSNKNVEGGYPYNNASCIHKVKCVYEGNDKSRQGEMIRELECFTAIKWSCIRSGTLQYPELIRLHWIVAAHNVTAWPLLSRMSRADITHHITSPQQQSCCHLVPKLAAITGDRYRCQPSQYRVICLLPNHWQWMSQDPIVTSLSGQHITTKDAAQHRSPCLIKMQVILHILCPWEVKPKFKWILQL